MTILDAYAVIAYLRDEPAAERVQPLLEPGPCHLTAASLAEVIDHLVRLAGADEEDVVLDLAQLDPLDVCRAEGVRLLALPGSDGSVRPTRSGDGERLVRR